MERKIVLKMEIDSEIYGRLLNILEKQNTTLEAVTEAFLAFCGNPENASTIRAYLSKFLRVYTFDSKYCLHLEESFGVYWYTIFDLQTRTVIVDDCLKHTRSSIDDALLAVCKMHGLNSKQAVSAPYTLVHSLQNEQDEAFQRKLNQRSIVNNVTWEEE